MQGANSTLRSTIPIIARFAVMLTLALLFGSLLAPVADAEKIPANGLSIARRVQLQKDMCISDGGTFTKKKTPFGATITNCIGGTGSGKCVNTKKHTDCSIPFTPIPVDPNAPAPTTGNAGGLGSGGTGTGGGPVLDGPAPTGGNAGGIDTGGAGSGGPIILSGNAGGTGAVAKAANSDQERAVKAPRDKTKKHRGGKKRR